MSVLGTLRQGLDSSSTKVFIGLVFLAFIAFFSGSGNNQSNNTSIAAVVNGTAITSTDVQLGLRAAASRRGKQPTNDELAAMRTQVVDQLVTEEVLVQEAQRLGVAVAPEEVARVIAKNTQFAGKDGRFDQKVYERYLRQADLTPARFETDITRQMLYEKLLWLVLQGVTVSDAEVRRAWEEQSTTVTLTWIRVPQSAFLGEVVVSDADRDAFIAANGEKLKARYDAAFEREYNLPKTYTLRTLLLRTDLPGLDDAGKAATRARADELRAQAAGGADFAALARRWSEDLSATNGGASGPLAATQLDPALVAAADAAGVGGVSAVTETSRGLMIVRVEAISDAKVIAFEDAQKDLAVAMLREDRVGSVAREYAGRILAAWTDVAAPPHELTDPKLLPVTTTQPFSLTDPPTAPPIERLPELAAALQTAKSGQVLPVPFESDGTFFLVAVADRSEPDESTYPQEKVMTRARLLYERKQAFVEDWLQGAKARATIEVGGVALNQ